MKRELLHNIIAVFACLVATAVHATGDNPFFSGDTITVDIQPDKIVLGNAVYQRTISSSLQTISLLNNGVETIANPSTEAIIFTPDLYVDASEGTITGTSVTDDVDSKVVRISVTCQDLPFTLCYRIFKGNRPYMSKWMEFPTPTQVDSVTLEQLQLKPAYVQSSYGEWGTSGIVAGGSGLAFGIQLNEMRLVSNCYRNSMGLNAELETLKAVTKTQENVLAICSGSRFTAALALQLYWGTYVVHASQQNRPVVYNTWYAYKWFVLDQDCYRGIPLAAQLGADYYVVDDGWQTKYGEWIVNGSQFPTGLTGVANATRAAGMKFGFWLAPALTKPDANNLKTDWLIKGADHAVWTGSGFPVYCFSTAWSDWIAAKTKDLVHQTGAEFLKLDFTVTYPFCFDQSHGHDDRKAQEPQTENWKKYLDVLRTEQPNIQIYRASTAAENSSYNDFGWWSDWILAGIDDQRRLDPRWWFRSADSTRYGTGGVRYLTPPWCISGTTPAHLYTLENRYDVLEYNITSIIGQYCNLEFSNRLEEIAWDEMATCQKWVRWYRKNQPYLAFSQFDDTAKRAYNAYDSSTFGSEYVDGAYHLRPLLNGRYGYLCFWNPADTAKTVNVRIKPSDYYLPAAMGTAKMHAINAGWEVVSPGPNLTAQFTMQPHTWEFIEVLDPAANLPSEITLRGTVNFEGLADGAYGPNSITFTAVDSAHNSVDKTVPINPDHTFRVDFEMPRGPFTLSAKPTHWLRSMTSLTNAGNNITGLQLSFLNGDAWDDDQVDLLDLVTILLDFDTDEGGPGDVDENGLVDLHDLVTVLINFGIKGDD